MAMRMGMTNWKNSPCIKGGNARYWWKKLRGPIPPNINVCHYCDNPWCKNLEHCFLGSDSINMKDCVSKGRYVGRTGLKTSEETKAQLMLSRAKLTIEEVKSIKSSNKSIYELMEEFNVSWQTIYYIKKGLTWRYV